ncbi:IclR family transcriptional regulator domain-containing protein, partial [Nocardia tengchongensis]|uniref:IclR family transcriptional regulator domain-containing protein n=1 Tax=Nocardia tengchongensis TaxID=2055889 RepID=UPI00361EA0CE
ELGAGYLQSLARGLAVLVSLGSARGGLTLAEAAKATGLPRATVRRAVQTLERLGYATAEGSRFVLLPRVLELGYADLSGLSFGEIVQPHLADLVARVHESASVAVLSGDDVVYVARVPTVNIMRVNITVGTRFPAYATAVGKAILAFLPPADLREHLPGTLAARTPNTIVTIPDLLADFQPTRQRGYSIDDAENREGIRGFAAPVFDAENKVCGAVSIAG